jgi:hypothetical protein
MAFNGSGSWTLPAGQPVTTGTTISSSTHNTLVTDIQTSFGTVICKDGQTTVTANLPMATFKHTGVGVAVATTDYARYDQVQNSTPIVLASVSGTNTVAGTASPTPAAYVAGQVFRFIPANDNTGATTLNVSSVGAGAVQWNGVACVGGELRQGIPVEVFVSTTTPVFNIIGQNANAPFLDTHPVVYGGTDRTKKVRFEVDGLTTATTRVVTVPDRDLTIGPTLGTEQASTSGTSIDFTGIPAGTKRVTVMVIGVSTNGTDNVLIQLGVSGGVEATGYVADSCDTGGGPSHAAYTTGFGINGADAGNTLHGAITFTLQDASDNTWVGTGIFAYGNVDRIAITGGSKALAAVLDRVRITTTGGTNTFDAGAINISFE